MSMPKILSQLLEQFKQNHAGKAPQEIVAAPAALASLAIKQSARPKVEGVPLTCRLFTPQEVLKPGKGTRLGVFIHNETGTLSLRSCDLA
ncbi:MAG: hypothetical protein ACOYB3_00655 [Azonexus sp.]